MLDFIYKTETGNVRIQLPDVLTREDFDFVRETIVSAINAIEGRIVESSHEQSRFLPIALAEKQK